MGSEIIVAVYMAFQFLIGVGIVILIIMIVRNSRKCPHCGRKNALRPDKTHSESYTSVEDVKHELVDADNNKTGLYYTQKENVTHSKSVVDTWRCKHCGHIFTRVPGGYQDLIDDVFISFESMKRK